MDRFLDQKTRSGDTDLAGIAEDGRYRAGNSSVEIGRVGKDDIGGFATKLEIGALQVRGCGIAHDPASHRAGAGEHHHIDIHRQRHRLADGLAASGNHIQHAGRQPGLMRQLAHAQQRQRRALARLDHHRIATGKRRTKLPGPDHQRKIPRDDGPDNTDRLLVDHTQNALWCRRNLTIDLVANLGIVAQRCGGRARLGAEGHADLGAVVTHAKHRQLGSVGLNKVGPAMHHRLARRRCHFRPSAILEGGAGHGDGTRDNSLVAIRQRRQAGSVDRRDDLDLLAGTAGVADPVDQVSCRCHVIMAK